jgi:hypothetical protein
MKLMTVIASTGLAAGLAIGGVAVASATSSPDPSSSGAVTLPAGGVLEKRVTTFCEHAPALAQRAERAQTRLSGDASVKGSLAWLKARQAKVDAQKHPRAQKRLDTVVERRSKRLARLPQRQKDLATAQSECATLPK